MLGIIFCYLWAHNWRFAQTNGRGFAVLICSRCRKGAVDGRW